jgi:hypothetical protein
MSFIVRGVPQDIADEVRRTRIAPEYGHPAHQELARGTGPCRCCLRTFSPGREERLLFTYRPPSGDALTAPGPVFIHAEHCQAWDGEGFPDGLRDLPLAFESRAAGSRVLDLRTNAEQGAEQQIAELFDDAATAWLFLRHAQAGCFIARIDRGSGNG